MQTWKGQSPKMKKILWINDDFINHYLLKKKRWRLHNLNLIMSKDFIYDKEVSLVVVDYGLLAGEHMADMNNVKILRKYFDNKIPLVWSGGLGGSDFYTRDCKKVFPLINWLHSIESESLEDLLWYVCNLLKLD